MACYSEGDTQAEVSVVRKLLGKKFKKYLARARPTLVGRLVAPACALARCNNTNTNIR